MVQKLIILGAGGHAVSVHNVAVSAGFEVKHFVDRNKIGQRLLGIEIIGDLSSIQNKSEYSFAIAVGANFVRERIYKELEDEIPINQFPPLIHQSSVICFGSSVGCGTLAMPNSTVGPNSNIGNFCLINTNSSIDHDGSMDDYSSLAPGCFVGGNVKIGFRSAVSIGAIVKHGIIIGNDTVIGANSYLNKEIGDLKIAYGSPAEVVRNRLIDEGYLG